MKLSIDVSTAIIGWCQDAAAQYRENDPAVGIFTNEGMAEAFDGLANLVEDMADGEVGPVDGMSRIPYMELGIALGEINSTINELEVTRDSIDSRIASLRHRAEAIKDEMRVTSKN
jgi:hypothetical protein